MPENKQLNLIANIGFYQQIYYELRNKERGAIQY